VSETLRDELYGSAVRLRPRPESVPTLLQPSWRVPLVPLMIATCRTARAKREQLVVLNWALRNPAAHAAVIAALAGERLRQPASIRYEPALVRAANIAHGLGLLERDGDWLALTSAGSELAATIQRSGAYARQRALLDALPRPLTLNAAQSLLAGGTP
jgi:hypothetical protein